LAGPHHDCLDAYHCSYPRRCRPLTDDLTDYLDQRD
jgi:hypothetical protein